MITQDQLDRAAARLKDTLMSAAEVMDTSTVTFTRPAEPATWRGRMRVLAPLAAAVSVTAVIVAAVIAVRYVPGTTRPQHSTTQPASSGLPGFYLSFGPGLKTQPIQVRRTNTGELTAAIPAVHGWTFAEVAASAGDRTFFADAINTSGTGCRAMTRIYRFSITDSGRLSSFGLLTQFSGSADNLAVAPDGSRLAYDLSSSKCAIQEPRIAVRDLTTETVRTWTSTIGNEGGDDLLSWSPDGRSLVVNLYYYVEVKSSNSTYDDVAVALDTASTGGPLAAHSRVLWGRMNCHPGCADTILAGPDDTLLVAMQSPVGGHAWVARIQLGQTPREQILYTWPHPLSPIDSPEIYADPSGRYIIFSTTALSPYGWIRDGRLVPLVALPSTDLAWLAWRSRRTILAVASLAGRPTRE
jgi:hypothetical protein